MSESAAFTMMTRQSIRPIPQPSSARQTFGWVSDDSTPPPTRVAISFVIPARNEERFIAACLSSIQALIVPHNCDAIEIIVVDNESTDQTTAISSGFANTQVIHVPPGSVSRARNRGAAVAKGDWIAFLDADCELNPDWLLRCLETAGQRDVVAIGAAMRCPASSAPWVEKTWFELAHRPANSDVVDAIWLPSFNLMVRASALRAIGGFDESLTTCEDSDLGYRLGGIGRLKYDRRSAVSHLGESKSLAEFFRREAWRSQGNIQGVLRRGIAKGEWPSLAAPPLITLVGLLGGFAVLASPFANWSLIPGLIAILFVALLLTALVLRKLLRNPGPRVRHFAPGVLLMAIYLVARTYGTLVTSRRVERRDIAGAK
jgi:GT2 family glycosyltransferase